MDNDILFASDPNWANDTDGKLWRIEKGRHFQKQLAQIAQIEKTQFQKNPNIKNSPFSKIAQFQESHLT